MEKSFTGLGERSVPVKDYLAKTSGRFRSKSLDILKTYRLEKDVVEELKRYADKLFVLVFSAEWCLRDCATNVPVLALLSEKAGLKVGVFGGLIKDSLNPNEEWRIPPTPPEVKDFNVIKVPHIVIFDMNGRELGTIIENHAPGKTLEEEILEYARTGLSP